jgi:hypothetical protein
MREAFVALMDHVDDCLVLPILLLIYLSSVLVLVNQLFASLLVLVQLEHLEVYVAGLLEMCRQPTLL